MRTLNIIPVVAAVSTLAFATLDVNARTAELSEEERNSVLAELSEEERNSVLAELSEEERNNPLA